jgi:K+-sensing histidine kinase KdpD
VVPHRLRSPLRPSSGLSTRRQLVSAAAAVIVLSLLTAILQAQRDDVSLTIVFLLYLGAVVALAAAGGPIVGVCVAIVAFLVVNWFFTEPVHTLNVSDPERLAELIIFLAVSGTVASLVDTATRRQEVLDVTTAENEELTAANDLRTALLRAVSHDLRTPLTTAKLATSSLLADDIVLPDDQRTELLHLADQEIDRLIGIVENLLDAGRLQAGALAVDVVSVSLTQLAERIVTTAAEDQRARITNAVRNDVPEVRGDLALLERVVANLVTNALTADSGNPIEIRAGDQPDGRVGFDVVDHGPVSRSTSARRRSVPSTASRIAGRAPASGWGCRSAPGSAMRWAPSWCCATHPAAGSPPGSCWNAPHDPRADRRGRPDAAAIARAQPDGSGLHDRRYR